MARNVQRALREDEGNPTRSAKEGRREGAVGHEQVVAVMTMARESGLTASKNSRISGRVSSELIERAKKRTGLSSDTELVEFALANIALEDNFIQVFREMRGTLDPDLDLEF